MPIQMLHEVNDMNKLINDKKGMTLIEAILGTVLIVIASLMMLRGFETAYKLVLRANQIKMSSTNAESRMELQDYTGDISVDVSESMGTVTMNGVTMKGQFVTIKDKDGGVTYKEFAPIVVDTE